MLNPARFLFFMTLIGMSTPSLALSMKLETELEGLYEDRTCAELYYAVSELEKRTLNYESALYNSRNNSLASVASTVFSPAIIFVGVSNAMQFKSELDSERQLQELNFLRQRMAEMNCFAN